MIKYRCSMFVSLNKSNLCFFQIADPADVAAAVEGDSVEQAFRDSTSQTAVAPIVADKDSRTLRTSPYLARRGDQLERKLLQRVMLGS